MPQKIIPAKSKTSDTATTAAKLSTKRRIDGVEFDGSADIHHYAACGTAAATAAKVATITGFKLLTGAKVTLKFTYTNTAANPTLNVSSTGAKAIRYNNANVVACYLWTVRADRFVYDGTYWQLVGDINTDTDSKVTNTLNETAKSYLTGTPSATTNTGTQTFGTKVYRQGDELHAENFVGSLNACHLHTDTLASIQRGTFNGYGFYSTASDMLHALITAMKQGRKITFVSVTKTQLDDYLLRPNQQDGAGFWMSDAAFCMYESQTGTTGRIFLQRTSYNNPRSLIKIEFSKSASSATFTNITVTITTES